MFKKRFIVVLSTALAFYLIGVNLQAGWLYFVSFSLIALTFIDLLFSLEGKGNLKIEREAPALSQADKQIKIKLKIKNQGRTKRLLVIEDRFLNGFKKTIFILPRHQEKQLEYTLTAKRGVYKGAEVIYYTAFPFNFFEFKRKVFVSSTIKVYPSFSYLTNFPLLEGGSFPKEVIHDWRKGSGTEFFGLREYRPGDSLRFIYWKKTAAIGEPVIKEFEKLVATKTLLIIDNTTDAYSNHTHEEEAFEETVKAVASISEYSIHCGHPVEMIYAEKNGWKHQKDLDWKEILEALAEIRLVRKGPVEAFFLLSTKEVYQKTVILFITPESQLDLNKLNLMQQARSRVFIFSQETYYKNENKLWEEKLARLEENNFFICRHQGGKLSKCLQEHWKPTAASAVLHR